MRQFVTRPWRVVAALRSWPMHRGVSRTREVGQVLPIFAIMAVVLLGGAALVTDVAWWWSNEQRMQRAADAGALAGAIYLPGNEGLAFTRALQEAAKNGYVTGVDGVTVSPRRDAGDPRKLIVDIDGPVGTHFARVFCWDGGPCLSTVPVSVSGAASYVLPVPMGSPQNYYGVGHFVDAVTTTTTTTVAGDTGWEPTTQAIANGQWSNPTRALSNNNSYATESSNGQSQQWGGFNLTGEIPNSPSTVIDGLEVRLNDVFINSSSSSCQVQVAVSWDGGSNWSPNVGTGSLSTNNNSDRTVGSASSTSAWGGHQWVRNDFTNSNFRVRLTWSCNQSRTVSLDLLEVQVYYRSDQTTTTVEIEEADVRSPDGDVLAPHNFWGALQSQGAPNIQGDAYMTYYDTRTNRTNDDYDHQGYYQYEIELPSGSSNGEVWLFDPGFCDVSSRSGTGEYWTVGGSNGNNTREPVSTYYDLWDTRNTPFDVSDDVLVGSSNNLFRRLRLSDHTLDVTHSPNCRGLSWHHDWWRIGNNLQGGRSYRLHTYSTDPSSSTDQRSTTALNAFAIWSKASGGTPKVHGLGAMEAYVRLPSGETSEFYLAQIDAEHAGKTMVIRLWDPGDTGNLSANLQILRPTSSSYQPTTFSYSAERGSNDAANCSSRQGVGVNSVQTNVGGGSTGLYNGCWLTIEVVLPDDYGAPLPSSDSVATEGGWWKIRYNMGSQGGQPATDLTTWEVQLRGNPVHLVLK